MIATRIVSTFSRHILPLLLFGFCSGSFAGADPAPTDWLPVFNNISFAGNDIVFDAAGETQIRLLDGQWGNSTSSPINTLTERRDSNVPKVKACSVPNEVLSKYRNGYNQPEIWYCDLPEMIWFASGGYCGEGDDDPESTQGHLFSYTPTSGVVVQYPGFLPKCAELAGLERVSNLLVAVTIYQGEYGQGAGDVIILDLGNQKAPPRVWKNPKPTGAVVGMSAYDKQCDCLWFATSEGIERLTVSNGKWEQRYFDFAISPDNRLVLTLSPQKPNDAKMWMGRVMHNFPIEDLRGFIKAWNQSPTPQYAEHPRTGSLLLAFYIAAIERTKDWEKDWTYSELMRLVAMHQDPESKPAARAFVEKMLKQPTKLSRKGEVMSAAKRLGVDAKNLEGAYFNDLLIEYFSGSKTKYSYEKDVVRYAFEHPEYLPRLRDYYQTNTSSFDIERSFLDAAKSYRMWQGYAVMASSIDAGLNRMKHRSDLFQMCALDKTPRNENKLLAILQARLETDAQAKLTNEAGWGEHNCISASFYWINYGGPDQVRRRIDLMLATAAEHKEYSLIIFEALNRKYATPSKDIDEWRRWWNSNSPTTNSLR